jgi:hypothetical protein
MYKILMTLAAALLAASPSCAAVFDVTGVPGLTGTLTITSQITDARLVYINSPPDYTDIGVPVVVAGQYYVSVSNGTKALFDAFIFDFPKLTSLTSIADSTVSVPVSLEFKTGCSDVGCATETPISATLTPTSPTATPLPAAFPLFATAIGGLGLLGRHSKRKAQALAA